MVLTQHMELGRLPRVHRLTSRSTAVAPMFRFAASRSFPDKRQTKALPQGISGKLVVFANAAYKSCRSDVAVTKPGAMPVPGSPNLILNQAS